MNLVKKTVFFITIFYLSGNTCYAQIVNTEKARMQSDTTGWMGNAGAAVSLIKNTQQVFTAEVHAHVQYKSKKSLYLMLGSYSFLKGGNNKLVDNTFLHFRYNYKLNKVLRWEVFTQLQNNLVTKIKSRYLLGTGPRFKILDTKVIRLYAASLFMYEYEKVNDSANTVHRDVRNSSYISFSITPNNMVEIVSTSFYQPQVNNLKDYRILNQASVKVKAAKKLSVSLNWNYLYDSYPAPGIPTVNYAFSTGLEYDF